MVRMDFDEDDNHYPNHDNDPNHDRNHQRDKERYERNDQLDFGRGRKRKRVISSEGSRNGQNNEDWAKGLHRQVEKQRLRQFRIQRNRRQQALPPVQTVTGAPVYISNLRTTKEEAFHMANNIYSYLIDDSSVSWTSQESISQERNTSIVNYRKAKQILAAQDNQEQLNQQENTKFNNRQINFIRLIEKYKSNNKMSLSIMHRINRVN
ncbi:MAG: hypothetical protein EZS28_031067 [Streblomastix strix]|uniref:Uncharacterized protein n=1 Tax=Streblomastix strix TaxID=222440 RepID=A0A5J4UT46_9EUKA|nr:MAG: hypothetical protein EZS28_031067 [Streblomastix strix]